MRVCEHECVRSLKMDVPVLLAPVDSEDSNVRVCACSLVCVRVCSCMRAAQPHHGCPYSPGSDVRVCACACVRACVFEIVRVCEHVCVRSLTVAVPVLLAPVDDGEGRDELQRREQRPLVSVRTA